MKTRTQSPSPPTGERVGERGRIFLLTLFLTGCFNPDDIFPIKGTVSSVDPVEGQVIKLLRDSKQAGFGNCSGALATDFKQTTADANGNFGFEVFRAQTQSLTNFSPFCFRVSAQFASGSRAWSDLTGIVDETRLSPLLDWRAAPKLENDVLQFSPPIPIPDEVNDGGVGTTLEHRAVVTTADGGVLWQVDDHFPSLDGGLPTREPMRIDAFALEDFSGTLELQSHLFVPPNTEDNLILGRGNAWPVELRAGQTLPLVGATTPLSRNLACPDVATPCPLTDGDLTSVEVEFRQSVSLNFDPPTSVSRVVLRAVETGIPAVSVLFLQEDGGTSTGGYGPTTGFGNGVHVLPFSQFDVLGGGPPVRALDDGGFDFKTGTPTWASITFDGGVGVQFKRVTLNFPGGLTRVAEISVFE